MVPCAHSQQISGMLQKELAWILGETEVVRQFARSQPIENRWSILQDRLLKMEPAVNFAKLKWKSRNPWLQLTLEYWRDRI